MSGNRRLAFGIEELDRALGGGLLSGTLTVIAGATGAGKTQLGLRWGDEGGVADGRRGAICDLTSRGDAQNHANYAQTMFGWPLRPHDMNAPLDLDRFWGPASEPGDYFHPFDRTGRRVTRRDLEPDAWHAWQMDLARVLRLSIAWLYGHLTRGTKRILFDGIEPTDRFAESIQFEFFEYLYHHGLRKEDEWVARELFRERFLANADRVAEHRYDSRAAGCLYLYTTPHVLLDDLMAEPIREGDIFTNANTIIYMGRTRLPNGQGMGRALYIAKHRGSACSDDVLPYRLTDRGLTLTT